MKKFVLVFVLFTFLPLLNSCSMNDAGIIKWTYKDELLDWKDIKNAKYYELVFYQTDPDTGEVVTPLTPVYMRGFIAYAYDSQYSFYGFPYNSIYNLKIKVYYEGGSSEESDLIHITYDLDFPYPIQFGFGDYVGYRLSWHMYSEGISDLVNYTLKINGEEFDIDTDQYYMDDYDSGIYKIQIRVNYETGSSKWSKPIYQSINVEGSQEQVNYNLNSGEDLTYSLDSGEDIIAVVGKYYLSIIHQPLPDEIVAIDDSSLTLNQYYLKTVNDDPTQIITQLYIYTDDNITTLYIMNDTSSE